MIQGDVGLLHTVHGRAPQRTHRFSATHLPSSSQAASAMNQMSSARPLGCVMRAPTPECVRSLMPCMQVVCA